MTRKDGEDDFMRPEIVQTHPFIDQWRAKGFQYYIVPKAMLRTGQQFGLGMDEVMLYVILRDRVNLSFENRWIDEDGRIYIVYTREEAARYLGWSLRKTIDVFARLVMSGLLTEKEQHNGSVLKLPKRLYVRQWAEPSVFHSVEELKNGGFFFLTEHTVHADVGEYYVLPQCLLEDPIYEGLGLRAALVYMMALDKLHLSIKYGKVDANGLVWCSLDSKEVCQELGCNEKTLGRTYKVLEEIGLIVRVRNGGNTKAQYRIYLRDYLPPPKDKDSTPPPVIDDIPAPQEGQFCAWDQKNLHLGSDNFAYGADEFCARGEAFFHKGLDKRAYDSGQNLHANQNLYPSVGNNLFVNSIAAPAIPTEKKEAVRTNTSIAKTELAVQRQISYAELIDDIYLCMPSHEADIAADLLAKCVKLMVADAHEVGTEIRLGNRFISKQEALLAYRKLDRYIVYTMLTKIIPRVNEIRNLPLYLHQALLAAVENHGAEAYYTQLQIENRRAVQSPPMDSEWPW